MIAFAGMFCFCSLSVLRRISRPMCCMVQCVLAFYFMFRSCAIASGESNQCQSQLFAWENDFAAAKNVDFVVNPNNRVSEDRVIHGTCACKSHTAKTEKGLQMQNKFALQYKQLQSAQWPQHCGLRHRKRPHSQHSS